MASSTTTSSGIVTRGLVHLYLCECTIGGVSANSGVVSFLNGVDSAAVDDPVHVAYPPHLDVHLNWLGDRGTTALAKTLLGLQWITSLDMRGCGVGEAGVAALCATIERHKGLRSLDLRQNAVYATSGRLLSKVVARRPADAPLLVLCDLDQLPGRIARALLQAVGRAMARVHHYEHASRVVFNTPQPCDRNDTMPGGGGGAEQFAQELLAHEAWLTVHYARLGPLVPLLALDTSLEPEYGASGAIEQLACTISTASDLRKQPSAFLQTIKRCFPVESIAMAHVTPYVVPLPCSEPPSDADTVAPYASETAWSQLAQSRGVLLREQWETVRRNVHEALMAAPPDALDDAAAADEKALCERQQLDILARVVSGIAATTAHDIPFFRPVEAHLDAVYTAVVVEAYEARRELSLVCQQIAYVIQNNKALHAAWRAAAGNLIKPARIDASACADVVQTFLCNEAQSGAGYAQQRIAMVRKALALLPPLMAAFLIDVVCEAAVTQLYAKRNIKRLPLEVLMQHSCAASADETAETSNNDAVVHAPKPPSSRPPAVQQAAPASRSSRTRDHQSIAAATAVANSAPVVLCGDLATILGSVRTAAHMKQLLRHYGQWLRWRYFCGLITEQQLVLP